MRRNVLIIVLTTLTSAPAASQDAFDFGDIAVYDPQADLAKVLECDRQAAHGEDPHRVAAGVWKAVADAQEAVLACEVAVEDHPESPRMQYQLSRAYAFADQDEKSSERLWRAVRDGYPQALFSAGYYSIKGGPGVSKDPCRGAALLQRSAQSDHYSGMVAYVHFRITGAAPADCPGLPLDPEELEGFVEAARQVPVDFFREALIEQLGRAVAAMPRSETPEASAAAADHAFGQ